MKIEMTEEQRNALLQLVENTQFVGKSAEAVVELKQILSKPEKEK